jgi:hypothetical protein
VALHLRDACLYESLWPLADTRVGAWQDSWACTQSCLVHADPSQPKLQAHWDVHTPTSVRRTVSWWGFRCMPRSDMRDRGGGDECDERDGEGRARSTTLHAPHTAPIPRCADASDCQAPWSPLWLAASLTGRREVMQPEKGQLLAVPALFPTNCQTPRLRSCSNGRGSGGGLDGGWILRVTCGADSTLTHAVCGGCCATRPACATFAGLGEKLSARLPSTDTWLTPRLPQSNGLACSHRVRWLHHCTGGCFTHLLRWASNINLAPPQTWRVVASSRSMPRRRSSMPLIARSTFSTSACVPQQPCAPCQQRCDALPGVTLLHHTSKMQTNGAPPCIVHMPRI